MDREPPEPDREEIRRTARLFLPPGRVTELRAFDTHQRTASGYFDDVEAFAAAAMLWSGKGPGVYFIPNAVKPDLLARACNRAKGWAKVTTGDLDIAERFWLLVDFDPVRPSGISATDAEHEAAIERAYACRNFLREQGWPEPLVGDSGNGGHLVYPNRLRNDDDARAMQEQALGALARQFDDARVQVDQTTFNAARLWKVYGTLTCKGDSTSTRPHRLARILEAPEWNM